MKTYRISSFISLATSAGKLLDHASSFNQFLSGLVLGIVDTIAEPFVNTFMNTSDPKIVEKMDAQGQPYFRVYDPVTGHSMTLNSEQEVRVWIEERYR